MLCAMSSRMPLGGIEVRYAEIVEAAAEGLYLERCEEAPDYNPHNPPPAWEEVVLEEHTRTSMRAEAEDRLCQYPLLPKVKVFFDQFVRDYGHSSIMELVGSPSVFIQGISWWTAYRSFDNPQVSGQEFSTRAIRHKNWPMARECYEHRPWSEEIDAEYQARIDSAMALVEAEDARMFRILHKIAGWDIQPNPTLQELHKGWLEIFEAEVEAWRKEFQSPCPKCEHYPWAVQNAFNILNPTGIRWDGDVVLILRDGTEKKTADGREETEVFENLWDHFTAEEFTSYEACAACGGSQKKYPSVDKEPFRPALDRARWAIPGTIATGCAHTANMRTMARVIHDGQMSAKHSQAPASIRVWEDIAQAYAEAVPGLAEMGLREAVYHNPSSLSSHQHIGSVYLENAGEEVQVKFHPLKASVPFDTRQREPKEYLDPIYNHVGRVDLAFQCSVAVARDWHRHRTMMPWTLDVVLDEEDNLLLHHQYAPISEFGKANFQSMMKKSSKAFHTMWAAGNIDQAMLCLPLGALVRLSGQGGLRDVFYMLELRRDAVGANFEYKAQATEAIHLLTHQLYNIPVHVGCTIHHRLSKVMGLPDPDAA